MQTLNNDEIREAVREKYGEIAAFKGPVGCGCQASSCCSGGDADPLENLSHRLGYARKDAATVPAGANLGLGCGNPLDAAKLRKNETVLDLGSGGGFDCFLAAAKVGGKGRVIGVDMTPEMVARARKNAGTAVDKNVDFRLGELENLPVADNSVDVIISNCVINLSPEKPKVFQEAFRVLKKGGRLAVSDMVAKKKLPETVKSETALHTACIAGASLINELERMLREAGFINIHIKPKRGVDVSHCTPDSGILEYVTSATIEAVKPKRVSLRHPF
jgi:arsenite methyltransferase